MDKKEFFKEVYRGGTGYAVIVLPNFNNKPTNDVWFEYPAQLDEMAEFAETNKTNDVWYSPILYSEKSRTKETSHTVSVLAADADSCDPHNFRSQPSLAVQTSEGHWHVYWYLDDAVDPHEAAKVNRRIAQVHKNQGCDTSFVNAAKLLRVPGTSNRKHPGAVVIVSDVDADVIYSINKLINIYPVSEVPDAIDVTQSEMPDDIPEYVEANRHKLMNGLPNSVSLRELLFGKFQEDKRSDVRFKLLMELYRIGLDDHAVMALAWGAPTNKYNGDDPRSYKGLWAEAMKAKAEYTLEVEKYGLGGDQDFDVPIGSEIVPEIAKKAPTTSFLSVEELESLSGIVSFVDEWVTWASSKTDAPAVYHRAAAITLLSIVYSEFGHALPKFGRLKLNLWFMVLGRSTKDRKSTSRGYMNRALRALKTEDYNYSLGDDVTPGGISLALHDRAHKSSVFDRDEVQGLFKELLHQSYMTGGLEVFTKLYDGWSGGRVRATGDKKIQESVPVSFIMYLMGILSETADVLTVTNYRSGFLTRFLYVIGSRPDGYRSPPIEQAPKDEDEETDTVFNGLINHLQLNRNHWAMFGGEGNTVALRADADAWTRFQQYERDVNDAAQASQYAEIIGTTSERMIISTLKMAGLLAMDDRSSTIKMVHILQAIEYGGAWFDDAVTVASMVSESEWQRDIDKLESFINSKGGTVSYSVAYKSFPGKRPFEFEEMILTLEQRGVLIRTQQGARWILKIDYSE